MCNFLLLNLLLYRKCINPNHTCISKEFCREKRKRVRPEKELRLIQIRPKGASDIQICYNQPVTLRYLIIYKCHNTNNKRAA